MKSYEFFLSLGVWPIVLCGIFLSYQRGQTAWDLVALASVLLARPLIETVIAQRKEKKELEEKFHELEAKFSKLEDKLGQLSLTLVRR